MHRCATCRRLTVDLAPCPCRLGTECPLRSGVCLSCWSIIDRNAWDRAHDLGLRLEDVSRLLDALAGAGAP